MSKIVKKKEQINATVSPWLKKRCVELANSPEFASMSDLVSQALSEFISKYDNIKAEEKKKEEEKEKAEEMKKAEESAMDFVLESLSQTKNGQELVKTYIKALLKQRAILVGEPATSMSSIRPFLEAYTKDGSTNSQDNQQTEKEIENNVKPPSKSAQEET